MRRIYFLVSSSVIAQLIVNELLLERIDIKQINIITKTNTDLKNLPEASILESSDFYPALEQGIALGGVTGLLAGLFAIALPTGLVLGGGAVLAISLAGAGLGGLMSSMIGISADSRRIDEFTNALTQGSLLMMIDVPSDRLNEIKAIIEKHHTEAIFEGVDPYIFP
jgi:hypothetical protein